jgi:hypothetical protein
MPIRRTLCLLAAMLAAGCSDPAGLPSAIDGSWLHADPAFHYDVTLRTDANTVSGVGQWSGEACCLGTVAVHGTIVAGTVDFDLDFVATQGGRELPPPFSHHFSGRLVGRDSLDGVLRVTDQVIPFGYHRSRSLLFD